MSDVQTPGTSIAIVTSSLPQILSADKEGILHAFAKEFLAFKPDASSDAGRKLIGQMKRKAGVAKMDLIRLGKTLREDADKVVKGIIAESKVITEKFDEIIEQIEAPLVAYKKQEDDRVAAHESALAMIVEASNYGMTETSAEIADRLEGLLNYPDRDWQEFAPRFQDTIAGEIARMRVLLSAAEKRESDAALLAKLQAEQAERDRLAEIERRIAHEKEIAAKARQEAEEAAKREIAAAAERERQAEARAAAAAEIERQRAAREEEKRIAEHNEALDIMRKLASPLTSRDPVVVIDMKLDQLNGYQARDWEEFAEQAGVLFYECMSVLQSQRSASVANEQEAAEGKRLAAEQAAVESERRRVDAEAALAKREADIRAANKEHKGKINREAMEDMLRAASEVHEGSAEEMSVIMRAVITDIIKKKVRHITIQY